jgi:hypothetical protein
MADKNLLLEAIKDTESLKEAALEAAKNQVIDMLLPDLKKLVNQRLIKENKKQLKECPTNEGEGDQTSMDYDMKDMDELASFFPQVEGAGDEDPLAALKGGGDEMGGGCNPMGDESALGLGAGGGVPGIPSLGESDDMDADDKEKVDEEIEISNEALEQIYAEALQTEVHLTKGFGEVTKGGDFGKEKPDAAAGIADVKSGEHVWAEETPPAKEDWQVKEGKKLQALILKGFNENKALRAHVAKLTEQRNKLFEMAKQSLHKLQEQNLFNSKVLHVNKLLNQHGRLTKEQKKIFMERIDRASSVESVKSIYETINETLKVSAQSLSENATPRKVVAGGSQPRTSGAPKVLSESATKQAANGEWNRVLELAGLKNKLK